MELCCEFLKSLTGNFFTKTQLCAVHKSTRQERQQKKCRVRQHRRSFIGSFINCVFTSILQTNQKAYPQNFNKKAKVFKVQVDNNQERSGGTVDYRQKLQTTNLVGLFRPAALDTLKPKFSLSDLTYYMTQIWLVYSSSSLSFLGSVETCYSTLVPLNFAPLKTCPFFISIGIQSLMKFKGHDSSFKKCQSHL